MVESSHVGNTTLPEEEVTVKILPLLKSAKWISKWTCRTILVEPDADVLRVMLFFRGHVLYGLLHYA